ncbi:His-Xaa-Ser system protein HxsD [Lutibacter sp. HS1-25]|uniref:His-Xaa-Ser system protein HxsD n=1 Tax=Lutibacter sp. HS1-25 TaxID=2485000 RepID=UPI0010131243|nr:His-Xaa-Ser system protein HxsD [Lutibacter sp. HS1-25]RXP46857.1 His-Xaa-Ser system protein HxsD [Lutibacter sp. HS1-25]
MITYSKERNLITCLVDSSIYNMDIIFKCFYWYGKLFSIEICKKEDFVEILIEKKEGIIDEVMFNKLRLKIKQDLIDFKTRDIVTKETKSVRELIIAKAFSNLSDEEEDIIFTSPVDR